MRAWSWPILAALGFGLMLLAYRTRPLLDPTIPWAYGLILIGRGEPAQPDPPGFTIPTRLRLLPGNERAEEFLHALEQAPPARLSRLQAELRPKLIGLALDEAGLGTETLETGRLPAAGHDEVLAGAQAAAKDRLQVAGRTLQVVGVLKPAAVVFADCYLIPPAASTSALFADDDPAVHSATLVRLSPEQFRDRQILQRLAEAYPSTQFVKIVPLARLDRRAFYLYLTGLAGLLLGGAGAWIGLFRWLAGRVRWPLLAAPLEELRRRPGLVWTVHLTYFALVVLAALMIYEVPVVQTVLLSAAGSEFETSGSPLGIAGQAYASGSIPRAAAVTFLINFLLGSLVFISLPSVIVPGAGVLVAALRAVLWGLLLAPASVLMAAVMLPHAWTLLLEGEGYILAAFFGVLIPIHLCQASLGGTVLGRFGRVLLLNLKANVLVVLVLALAACYEAIEVIQMAR